MHASLFATCLTDLFDPQAAISVVRVLRRLGVDVDFPADQTCCGQPAYNNGFFDEARTVAKRFIEVFEPSDLVVTPSSSCCGMVREHYVHLFADDPPWADRARAVAAKTFEFTELLCDRFWDTLSDWPLRFDGSVTYHYSCHMRLLGLTDTVERLLGLINGLDYRPLEKKEQCCGFGGAFAVRVPEVSGAMVSDKVACILATEADTVICTDAGCAMNIAGKLHRDGHAVQMRHIAEILDHAMTPGRQRKGATQ